MYLICFASQDVSLYGYESSAQCSSQNSAMHSFMNQSSSQSLRSSVKRCSQHDSTNLSLSAKGGGGSRDLYSSSFSGSSKGRCFDGGGGGFSDVHCMNSSFPG
jgi:hypothetical protein